MKNFMVDYFYGGFVILIIDELFNGKNFNYLEE